MTQEVCDVTDARHSHMDTVESIKGQLGALLGSNGLPYWHTLSEFVAGKTSRIEFEREMKRWLTTPELGKSLSQLSQFPVIISQDTRYFSATS